MAAAHGAAPRGVCWHATRCKRLSRSLPIELRQLRYFVRIADIGSLSRAAAIIHVAQSALSQQMAALEAELGAALLHRTARGVTLTDAGRRVYRQAQAILQQAQDLKASAPLQAHEPSGIVSLGIPLSVAATLALPIFEAVSAAYPKVRLHIYEIASATILEWVTSGRLHMGFVFEGHDFAGLQRIDLFDERLYLVVPPGAPLARRKTVRLAEVAAKHLVLPSPGLGVRPRLERACASAGLALSAPAAELNSMTLMKQVTEGGLGPAVFGWASIATEVAAGRLTAVEIVRPTVQRTAMLYLQKSTPGDAVACVAQRVTDSVREQARRAAWRGVRTRTMAVPVDARSTGDP